MKLWKALGATLLFATPALADVPRYDPAGYCKTVAESIGGSAQIERTCIQQEQSAYNAMKAGWSSYPGKATSYCDQVASSIGGSYQILKTCIQQETEAASSTPEFKF